jgi:TonB family protein
MPMLRVTLVGLLMLGACAAPVDRVAEQRQASTWIRAVNDALLSKRYFPVDPSRKQPIPPGTANVRFAVARNGAIYTPQIERSAGDALLDSAALMIVMSTSPLPPPPPSMLRPDGTAIINVPINFNLASAP